MKTKITAILTILAASVFAFAEPNPQAAETTPNPQPQCAQQPCPKAPDCKGKPQWGKRARPQITPEMRDAHVQRILLSLDDEQLAKLAARVAEIQKMTPEQKAEAVKALPKPEFRPGPKGGKGPQPRAHHRGPGPKGKPFPQRAPRGNACGCPQQGGAPVPPPPPPPQGEQPEGAPDAAPEAAPEQE